jgi:hypothetical protein
MVVVVVVVGKFWTTTMRTRYQQQLQEEEKVECGCYRTEWDSGVMVMYYLLFVWSM